MIEYLPVVREIITILGVIIGVTYYVITIRNQTKTRHMQIIQGIETHIQSSKGFNYNFIDVTWENYEDFMLKHVGNFFSLKDKQLIELLLFPWQSSLPFDHLS